VGKGNAPKYFNKLSRKLIFASLSDNFPSANSISYPSRTHPLFLAKSASGTFNSRTAPSPYLLVYHNSFWPSIELFKYPPHWLGEFFTVLGFNPLGDAMREALDPRLKI